MPLSPPAAQRKEPNKGFSIALRCFSRDIPLAAIFPHLGPHGSAAGGVAHAKVPQGVGAHAFLGACPLL